MEAVVALAPLAGSILALALVGIALLVVYVDMTNPTNKERKK